MTIEELEKKLKALSARTHGINDWIRNNPQVTEPNAYEMMDCNIEFAEILAGLRNHYIATGDITPNLDETNGLMATVNYLAALHPSIDNCYFELGTMDDLRAIATHPFFSKPVVNDMYSSIKASQDFATYVIPTDEGLRRIKRELLCKSISVPFYIWQVQQNEPNYKFDNVTEYVALNEMKSLYEESETPPQFGDAVTNMLQEIEKNYKYSAPKVEEAKK